MNTEQNSDKSEKEIGLIGLKKLSLAMKPKIMIGIQIKNGFLDFAKTDFECPHCEAKYSDADDKYLKRCEKNKSWTTKINCKCGKPFFMTYNYMGDAVSFL